MKSINRSTPFPPMPDPIPNPAPHPKPDPIPDPNQEKAPGSAKAGEI
ncbi:hypothetical protein [Nitrosomonas sp. Nm166]|nr:hypothetical protein [Nitrosomonas sp. Nm166]SFF16665.1 hypothetical protein SAMN05428977_10619 [Nitrosomonas sp. Nm166]